MKSNFLRLGISLLFCTSIVLSCIAQKTPDSAENTLPNVLMILVDDFGWRDLSGTGSDFYETPHMDKLISQSMKFNRAYASYPRCVPSRYAILTGEHPAKVNTNNGEKDYKLVHSKSNLGTLMGGAGYSTFYVGKWHLGGEGHEPDAVGFDISVAAGGAGGVASHFAPYNMTAEGKAHKGEPLYDLDDAPKGENLEDRLTEEAVKLLEQNRNKRFFGVLAHYAVHTPIEGKEEYVKYFKKKLKKNGQAEGPEYEQESAGENKLSQDNAKYAAMIKSVDDGVGRILEYLETTGLAEKTLVIVTSDHGGLSSRGNKRQVATTNRPLRAGKGHLYEGGIRVPMFVKWHGITKPGSESDAPLQGTDHFATLQELVGAAPTLDGKSYLAVLKGEPYDPSRKMFWHNPAPRPKSTADLYSSAMISGEYKLLDFYAEDRIELYNLRNDEGEYKNLVKEKPKVAQEMMKELKAWRKEVNANMKIKPKGLRTKE